MPFRRDGQAPGAFPAREMAVLHAADWPLETALLQVNRTVGGTGRRCAAAYPFWPGEEAACAITIMPSKLSKTYFRRGT